MKQNIPFDDFIIYTKINLDILQREKTKICYSRKMSEITWQDWEDLIKSEMEQVPIEYIYDWIKVTENYDKKDIVKSLYTRYGIEILNSRQYLEKFDNSNRHKQLECSRDSFNINAILSDSTLCELLKKSLVFDEEYISLIEKCWGYPNLKELHYKDRADILISYVGNECRTYIMKVFALKTLYKLSFSKDASNHLDSYWQDKLNKTILESNKEIEERKND